MLVVSYHRLDQYMFTKPEVHNASQRRQATAINNVHKNWRSSAAWFASYASAGTDRLITILRTSVGAK